MSVKGATWLYRKKNLRNWLQVCPLDIYILHKPARNCGNIDSHSHLSWILRSTFSRHPLLVTVCDTEYSNGQCTNPAKFTLLHSIRRNCTKSPNADWYEHTRSESCGDIILLELLRYKNEQALRLKFRIFFLFWDYLPLIAFHCRR